jgi:Na+-translocating ferredoxin:NAD+ oxidoreductase RnfC subunit
MLAPLWASAGTTVRRIKAKNTANLSFLRIVDILFSSPAEDRKTLRRPVS